MTFLFVAFRKLLTMLREKELLYLLIYTILANSLKKKVTMYAGNGIYIGGIIKP